MGKERKKKTDGDSSTDIGMVMTVSLFMILLTFFILLNSIAVRDDHRTRLAIGSLIGAFGGLPGGLSPMESGKSILPPSAPMESQELTLEDLMVYVKQGSNFWPGDIKFKSTGDSEIITITSKALFIKDQIKIKPSISPFLDKLCRIINKGNYPVEIAGFTDNLPAQEKGFRSNWEMSTLMAINILKYFVSKCSVNPKRLTAYGRGSNKPLSSNDTEQSRARNQRIEIILKYHAPDYIKRIFKKKPAGFFTYKKFDFRIFK